MTMDPRLQAWLDGEIEPEDLPAELRGEAAAWESVIDDVRSLPAPGAAPDAAWRVMAAVRAEAHRASYLERVRDGTLWLVRPRPIRLSPLLAAAALALVVWSGLRVAVGTGGTAAADGRVYVQFVITNWT